MSKIYNKSYEETLSKVDNYDNYLKEIINVKQKKEDKKRKRFSKALGEEQRDKYFFITLLIIESIFYIFFRWKKY